MNEPNPLSSTANQDEARIVRVYSMNDLIGNIMPLIEMLGLDDKQEKPLKDAIKQIIWREWDKSRFFSLNGIEKEVFEIVHTKNEQK